jgi:hypothetical protein
MRMTRTDTPGHGTPESDGDDPPGTRPHQALFGGATPPAEACRHARALLERVAALSVHDRVSLLMELRMSAPAVACLLSVALCREDTPPEPFSWGDWMHRSGPKTASHGLAQLFQHDVAPAPYLDQTIVAHAKAAEQWRQSRKV